VAKSVQLSPGPRPGVAPVAAPPPVSQPVNQGVKLTGLPLPTGRVFEAPAGMTELERNQLKQVGWDGGKITPEMQAAVQAMNADARVRPPVPIDPATPAVDFQTKDISELPPEEQHRARAQIAEALQSQPATAHVGQQPRLRTGEVQAVQPGPALNPHAQKVEEAKMIPVAYGEPARPATRPIPGAPTAKAVNPKAAKPAAPQYPVDPAEAARSIRTEDPIAPMENCPHCGWELARPDIPEPDYTEKMGFLSTQMLGDGKPFVKVYELLGGNLKLTFRTLTIREVDACYRQANLDRDRGDVESQFDWTEKVNRYRLYLQLQRVQSDNFDHDLPDGLSKLTNPNAEAFWEFPEDEEQPLRLIENFYLENVLSSESLCRIAQQHCGRFNRLVAKLEAQVDNDSFWKATGEQSSQ